jgi:hypothetical protein
MDRLVPVAPSWSYEVAPKEREAFPPPPPLRGTSPSGRGERPPWK